MRIPPGVLAMAACLAQLPARVGGQEIQLRPSGQRTLTGVVRDTSGFPIDADVMIMALRQRVHTDAEGRFTFRDVRPGRYQVAARRIGYFPQVKVVAVTENGAVLEF